MILRLHGQAGHVAHRSVTMSASPSNSKISTRKHEKYTVSIVKRSYDKTYYNTYIIRLIMISAVYTGVRARPSRSRGCRSVRSRCRHARFVAVTFLRGFDGVIVFFVFFPMCVSLFERNNRKKKNTRFSSSPDRFGADRVRRVPYASRK